MNGRADEKMGIVCVYEGICAFVYSRVCVCVCEKFCVVRKESRRRKVMCLLYNLEAFYRAPPGTSLLVTSHD